jgi:hypothetical protein
MEASAKLESAFSPSSKPQSPTVNPAGSGAEMPENETRLMERPAVKRIASSAHQAVDRMALVASQAAYELDEKNQQMKNAGSRIVDSGRGLIKEYPLASLSIGILSGFLIRHLLPAR